MTKLIAEPCPCGRTIRRMQRITHRSDDMFIIRGVNVFPSQIETALLSIEDTAPHYQIVLTRSEDGLDDIEVRLEIKSADFGDTIREVEAFQRKVQHQIHSVIGIRVKISLVQPGSIPRSEGKAKRVIDQRVF